MQRQTLRQALNIFLGHLLSKLAITFTIDIFTYYVFGVVFPILKLIVLCYALYRFGQALITFTQQDRQSIYKEETIASEGDNDFDDEEPNTDGITLFSKPNGRGYYNLSVGLSQSQLQAVVQSLLNTKTLPINYLEGIGVSRQDAEKLRAELSRYGIIEFDKRGRVTLTRDGKKSCQHILA